MFGLWPNCKVTCLKVDIALCPRCTCSAMTSDSLNLPFSQDDADSLARDYMKHRDHQRMEKMTNGSPSPSCLKVGEANILDPGIVFSIGFMDVLCWHYLRFIYDLYVGALC